MVDQINEAPHNSAENEPEKAVRMKVSVKRDSLKPRTVSMDDVEDGELPQTKGPSILQTVLGNDNDSAFGSVHIDPPKQDPQKSRDGKKRPEKTRPAGKAGERRVVRKSKHAVSRHPFTTCLLQRIRDVAGRTAAVPRSRYGS
jgi:hypothetical protein